MLNISEESLTIIVSTLIDSKIEAEKNNNHGINDEHIKAINTALEELKQLTK